DALGRLQREASGEDGDAPEQCALVWSEKVVAPVDQRSQRLLAGEGRTVASPKQAEPVAKGLGDGLGRKRTNAARPQLAREGNAVESMADVDDEERVLLGDLKVRLHGDGAVGKKANRREFGKRCDHLRWSRGRERRQRIDRLSGHMQRLTARRENPHLRNT